MSNRADRRASAKIARQAMRRARSPAEKAILGAAASFSDDGLAGELGLHLGDAGFDEAWTRLADDLHDILLDRYSEFRTEVYAQAGLGVLGAAGPGGVATEMGTRLFLCPVSGAPDQVSAFAGDVGEIARLEASLREFGVVPDEGRCLVLPFLVPIAAFAPDATPPGRVRALHDYLSDRLIERLSGEAPPSPAGIRDALNDICGAHPHAGGTRFGALVGIELVPNPPSGEPDTADEELDAEAVARAAAVDSWYDSYAADLSGVALGAPLDWPAAAAALAWETIRIPMEAALRERGAGQGRPDRIHCGLAADGERFVASAVAGSVAVGPFSAPAQLAWFDIDEFFDRAEASAETFVEHDNERDVMIGRMPDA